MSLGKILIIDDDKAVREVVNLLLSSEGFDVIEAIDGEDCYKKIIVDKPDLILLDIIMPKINGYILLNKITQDNELKNIPVILLTATSQMAGNISLKSHSVDNIHKPFEPDDLINKIKKKLIK